MDVDQVLVYIKNLPDNAHLSLKLLPLKLVFLLAIIQVSCSSELAALWIFSSAEATSKRESHSVLIS